MRARYLGRLGFFPKAPKSGSGLNLDPRSTRHTPTSSVPLKRDLEAKDDSATDQEACATEAYEEKMCTTGGGNPPLRGRSGSVSFDKNVTVRQIPVHTEYSQRIRNQLWLGRKEMQENACRNAFEFAAENWDWRQATEDEDMIRDLKGEMVHPVHYQHHNCNLQQQFFMVMSAQRGAQQSSF